MKTLFLIDGAYQEAKTALCSILQRHESVPNTWCLINKYSTKLNEKEEQNDLLGMENKYAEWLLKTYNDESDIDKRVKLQHFCYNYPNLPRKPNFIYCIDTEIIDGLINKPDVKYGFLVVRDPKCINDLIYKYEQNGRLNVVPIFLYTDYTYISATEDQDKKEKWKNLWKTFVGNSEKHDDDDDKYHSGEVDYEGVLIFNAVEESEGPFLQSAEHNLVTQLKALVKRVKNKNKDMVVVTERERTYIPSEICGFKNDIESAIDSPQQYGKNIFIMMKYHGGEEEDDLYMRIKNVVESIEVDGKKIGYKCIRADDNYIKKNFHVIIIKINHLSYIGFQHFCVVVELQFLKKMVVEKR